MIAGTSIKLKLGFTANSGCNFTAIIDVSLVVEPERFYYLKDHLGSIRVTVNEDGEITSYDDYDPWGMILNGRSNNFSLADNKYKFTGKERDLETKYDYFGARYYDSRIGRWLSVDPLEEKYPGWSPYVYTFNNPMIYFDPDGKDVYSFGIFYGRAGSNGVGGGVTFSWVWDDLGRAGLLVTGGIGIVGGKITGSGMITRYENFKSIEELEGLGFAAGLNIGGAGFEFNGDPESPTFVVPLIPSLTDAAAYVMGTQSQLAFSAPSKNYREIIDHVSSGGKISFEPSTFSITLYDDNGKKIKTVKLNEKEIKTFDGNIPERGDKLEEYLRILKKAEIDKSKTNTPWEFNGDMYPGR